MAIYAFAHVERKEELSIQYLKIEMLNALIEIVLQK